MYRRSADKMIFEIDEQVDRIIDLIDSFAYKNSELLTLEMKEELEIIRDSIKKLSTDIELYWEE